MSELVEQVARQMARSLNPGNVAAVEAHWPAFVGLARAALSVLEPRIEAAVAAERERCAGIAERCLAQCQSNASQFEFTSTEARHYRVRANEAEIIAAAIRAGEAEQ